MVTVTCDNASLVGLAKTLVKDSLSPLLGRIAILKATDFRTNGFYKPTESNFMQLGSMSRSQLQAEIFADQKHQCRANLVTDKGEITLYYDGKVVDGDT